MAAAPLLLLLPLVAAVVVFAAAIMQYNRHRARPRRPAVSVALAAGACAALVPGAEAARPALHVQLAVGQRAVGAVDDAVGGRGGCLTASFARRRSKGGAARLQPAAPAPRAAHAGGGRGPGRAACDSRSGRCAAVCAQAVGWAL